MPVRRAVLIAGLWIAGCATTPSVDPREASLSDESRATLAKYRQFMTQRQVEHFLAYQDDALRKQYLASLQIDEGLERYPPNIRAAIWNKEIVMGMDKGAVLLSRGTPFEREFENRAGNEIEIWVYKKDPRGRIRVTISNGFVTDVADEL